MTKWFVLALFLYLISGPAFAEEAAKTEAAPAVAAETAPAKEEFTGEALQIKKKMEELFESSKKVNGSGKDQARKKIETALDWEAIARACLGNAEWKKQGEKNRNEFKSLLKDVIVRTAYSRMDKFWDNTQYRFTKIESKSGEAHVVSKFDAAGEPLVLEYYLSKRGSDWLITDISFEDNRYSTNINEQLTAFLKEKSFSNLLTNLKKRRDELASGKTKKG